MINDWPYKQWHLEDKRLVTWRYNCRRGQLVTWGRGGWGPAVWRCPWGRAAGCWRSWRCSRSHWDCWSQGESLSVLPSLVKSPIPSFVDLNVEIFRYQLQANDTHQSTQRVQIHQMLWPVQNQLLSILANPKVQTGILFKDLHKNIKDINLW